MSTRTLTPPFVISFPKDMKYDEFVCKNTARTTQAIAITVLGTLTPRTISIFNHIASISAVVAESKTMHPGECCKLTWNGTDWYFQV